MQLIATVLVLLGLYFLGLDGMMIVVCWLTMALLLFGFAVTLCAPPPSPEEVRARLLARELMEKYRNSRPWI